MDVHFAQIATNGPQAKIGQYKTIALTSQFAGKPPLTRRPPALGDLKRLPGIQPLRSVRMR